MKCTSLNLVTALFVSLLALNSTFALPQMEEEKLIGDYRIHLYFGDTAPFIDDLKISLSPQGEILGVMHVPNDFDGQIETVQFDGSHLGFQILVPKNKTRPVDLLFRYESNLFSPGASQFSGFVKTIAADGKPISPAPYTASFLMFRKKP